MADAFDRDDLEDFRRALADGADANFRPDGEAPLLVRAALQGEAEYVRALIAGGADLEARLAGCTALMWLAGLAVHEGHDRCAAMLLAAGCDVNATTPDAARQTSLDLAARWRNVRLVPSLRAAGCRCSKASEVRLERLNSSGHNHVGLS